MKQGWKSNFDYRDQNPALYNNMTMIEILDYMLILSGVKNKKDREEKIIHAIITSKLKEYSDILFKIDIDAGMVLILLIPKIALISFILFRVSYVHFEIN